MNGAIKMKLAISSVRDCYFCQNTLGPFGSLSGKTRLRLVLVDVVGVAAFVVGGMQQLLQVESRIGVAG